MESSILSNKLILLCLVCTLMFNSVMCSSKFHCNEKDLNTLLHFKHVADPSGSLSSWITEQDCCQWKGIACDNITGRVTHLSLPCHPNDYIDIDYGETENKSHCLTGEFSLCLLELEFLSYLNLRNNAFHTIHKCDDLSRGTSPHLYRNSSKLQYLDLSHNYDIVIDNFHWISHLFPELHYLDLSYNYNILLDLHWISQLSSLQYLDLSGVDLHEANDWLQSVTTTLPSLSELHLEGCQLENINPYLQHANFTSLEILNLADNNFMSDQLPDWLFNLSCDVSHIDLGNNQIHGQLTQTLPNFRTIKSLILSQNYLKGPIPNWLGELEQLQKLDISENFFSGPIPTSLGNISSMVVMDLFSNQLSGNLPENLGQLFNLEALLVDDNFLTGIVSERNLLFLSNLKYLYLSSPALIIDFDPKWVPPFQLEHIRLGYVNNKFPSWLFTHISLRTLMIMDSRASFEPLDMFWNFATQIEFLSLTNNTINGDMSDVLLNSTVAFLNSNNLSGSLPRLSPQVAVLNLYNNSLSGNISSFLCHKLSKEKRRMEYLEIGSNLLYGELGDCWVHWKSLAHIGLSNNNLSGKIPSSLGSLSNLLSLDLNSNALLGEVPLSLKNCQNLCYLDLAENNLSGEIPRWMGQSVQSLLLRSNQFTGHIPIEICQLDSLVVMDFANNKLSGPIPNCFRNITAMLSDYALTHIGVTIQLSSYSQGFDFEFPMFIKGNKYVDTTMMNLIDLSNNNLSGRVPSEIFSLTGLHSLNLSYNHLVGTIPEDIGTMKPLESLDLSRNHFSGEIPESMSALSFLDVLNLSFNDFVGKIPSGTQLQGFTDLSYVGNSDLCGPPLTKICPHDRETHNTNSRVEDEDDDEAQVYSFFYMGLGIGFAVGFLGVLSAIFFNTTFRHAYFRFLYQLRAIIVHKCNSIC